MIIGLLGDIHGRIRLALTGVLAWQARMGKAFDLLVQVGDMGAFARQDRMDAASRMYSALDPAEGDFGRMLTASGPEPDSTGTAAVDPFGLLRYVPDGSVLPFGGMSLAFMGGIETADPDPAAIDQKAYSLLSQREKRDIDLLITHDAPLAVAKGFDGKVQGSTLISRLLDRLQPRFHVAGHYHVSIARTIGGTRFLCLDNIVASARWDPRDKGIRPGWLAVLDTGADSLSPIDDAVITGIESPEVNDMRIRAATDDDAAALTSVVHQAFEQYRGRLDPPSGAHSETIETTRQKLAKGGAAIASIDGQVVGCVFWRHEPTYVYVGRLAVLPSCRKRGAGDALLSWIDEKTVDLGLAHVQLGVRTAIPELKGYYEKRGYRVIRYGSHEGYSVPTYMMMEKDLSKKS